ncbi:hypothetical protein Slin_3147 [Spirosoma linguale DSM 74]|uniref:Uncharacterized protein n=1 Tax=Spirosoma linguale (strain ATCC 33905 / DSM 74 / LMG 10896 / Claus 1) TaxID=504472 RepID=D2QM95_SPILD|nr:hypothetical protein Slin_3147 [Spirosoma linguale DSM 74]
MDTVTDRVAKRPVIYGMNDTVLNTDKVNISVTACLIQRMRSEWLLLSY